MTLLRCTTLASLAVTVTIGSAAAQDAAPKEAAAVKASPDVARLDELLTALGQLPAGAWQARLDALEQQIEAHTRAAAELRREANRLKSLRSLLVIPAAAAQQGTTSPAKTPAPMTAPARAPVEESEPHPKPAPPPAPTEKPAPKAKLPAKAPDEFVTYDDDIEPILTTNCIVCHDEDEASGGLIVTSHASLLEGGSSGTTVVVGEPESSRLYRLVAHLDRPWMPKDDDQLPAAEIDLIRKWIAYGAPADKATAPMAWANVQQDMARGSGEVAARTFDSPPPMPRDLPPVALAAVAHAPALKALAASPRAPLLAVAGHRQVLLIDSEQLTTLGVLPFPLGDVTVLRFSLDGARLLAAGGQPGRAGGAVLFDVVSGSEVARFAHGRDTALAAAISPRQSLVALGGPSKKVEVFGTSDGASHYTIDAHRDFVLSVDISPDGNYLATADRGGTIGIWEADTGRPVHTIRPGGGAVRDVSFRPDARVLACAVADGTVRCYNVATGRQTWSRRDGGDVGVVAWTGDQSLISSGGNGVLTVRQADGSSATKSPELGAWTFAVAAGAGGALFVGDEHGRLRQLSADGKTISSTEVPTVPDPAL